MRARTFFTGFFTTFLTGFFAAFFGAPRAIMVADSTAKRAGATAEVAAETVTALILADGTTKPEQTAKTARRIVQRAILFVWWELQIAGDIIIPTRLIVGVWLSGLIHWVS